MRSMVGTVIQAITLQRAGAEFTEAAEATEVLTDNYLKMTVAGRHEANRWMNLRVNMADEESLRGEPLTTTTVDRT